MSRARVRVGRSVEYLPTDAEATAFGAGPFPARITAVSQDGSVSLHVDVPPGTSLAGTIDGTYAQSPEGDILEGLRDLAELRAKANVNQGSTPGTFSLNAGPQAL